MYRTLFFLLLAMMAVGLSAQEMTDGIVDVPVVDVQVQEMQKGVKHAWDRAHKNLKKTSAGQTVSVATRQKVDSLLREVQKVSWRADAEDYLYDMRLPLVSTGTVPDTSALHLQDYMAPMDSLSRRPDATLYGFEHHYDEQMLMEKELLASRFKYAIGDPRRYIFARRKYDVLTQSSQIIDTRDNVLTTRLVDESELELGDATLEGFSQTIVLKADKWHWKGDHSLQMQQTALSDNWYKGGENNMAVSSQQKLVVSRYDENANTTFDMTMDLKLSGFYTKADTVHSLKVSDNVFSLDMKYSYRAWKKWYYSTQLYAKTPIFDQYQSNSRVTKATILSPLEVNLSVGMDYKYTSPDKSLVYSLMLAPVSYNLKYVRDERVNPTSYGIDEGDFSKHEFGSTLTQKLEWKMGKNASWSSRLYCFTSYQSVLVEFENTFNFNIGRFFSARIYAYPRFDDSKDNRIQVKEMVTFGFSYQW